MHVTGWKYDLCTNVGHGGGQQTGAGAGQHDGDGAA
jgi:hypothetical protein